MAGRGIDTGRGVGTYQDDGAPEIWGWIAGENETYYSGGAFTNTGGGTANKTEGNYGNNNYLEFRASRVSAVYGRSPNELRVKNISLVPVITYA